MRKSFSQEIMAKVALAAIKEEINYNGPKKLDSMLSWMMS